jgi:hypothetical protein
MRLLGLDLIPVRPDLLLGLNSEHIQVKESAEQGARQVTFNQLDLQKYIFSRSVSSPENDCGWEGWDVVIGNSDRPSSVFTPSSLLTG